MNGIGDMGATSLAGALRANTTLATLSMWGACVASPPPRHDRMPACMRGVRIRRSGLTRCGGACADNHIGEEGARALALALRGNTALTRLNLTGAQRPYGTIR